MTRASIDLNCDMGEGFGHWSYGDAPDEDLMPIISSANVATGFHAGDPMIMDRLAGLAREHDVGLGAHPAYRDMQGFGRRAIAASSEELVNDILYQVGALDIFARRHGIALSHVKPHGALYMTAAKDRALSEKLIEALQVVAPNLPIFCMGVSETWEVAQAAGHPARREFYADREYDASGAIVFARKAPSFEPAALADKCVRACVEGKVTCIDGHDVDVAFESICFHSDTPGARDIGRAIRDALEAEGITVARPAS
ncbi:hypothetical protein ROJ8625_00106 [Roseivivax jejudonensis]|uniref:LamB/YcsF family protein n=1 Tax=Roseivivax jejudonensis TaxID=1529041 RepID=A0A1X6Y3L2_9RHOB|nr:5-oxoprolinase subunit PxpA [Roseivivax jejudonensis]SLN09820.1 hypothetical protein ROJ8625_00106 [Roseivivax jejudonensis]